MSSSVVFLRPGLKNPTDLCMTKRLSLKHLHIHGGFFGIIVVLILRLGSKNRTRICFSQIEGMYRIILCSVVCQVIRVERTVTMASFRCLFRILLACQASITHRTHKTIMSSRCSRPHFLSYSGS